jgi:hypothetical protein
LTLTHWFISEGLFYVQILLYDIHGKPIPTDKLVTCGVSSIPLELGMFLMIGVFLFITLLGLKGFETSSMPITFEWSVVISAACHPPRLDLDSVLKPVQCGAVEDDPDASFLHYSFSSNEVKHPETNVQYA